MQRRVLIVHGIHTNDSATWMDFMVQAFRVAGWDARKWTYGYAYAALTRWQNPGRAQQLADLVEPGDVILGHSNGGCLAWMASQLKPPIGGAILLNPALDCDKVMAAHVPWVNLYPNRFDEAVPLAAWFGFRDIAPHPWGEQGQEGISVEDARYFVKFTDEGAAGGIPAVRGHSGVLHPGAIAPWTAKFIADAECRMA